MNKSKLLPDQNIKKTFVLDTNVLLNDSESILKFENCELVIPLVVLEELDKIKSERTAFGRNAREISRRLDGLRQSADLTQGVAIPEANNCTIRVTRVKNDPALKSEFSSDVTDNSIILTAKSLQKQGANVVFISKDINARIKADLIGLPAEDYRRGLSRGEEHFKGFVELELDHDSAKAMTGQKLQEYYDGAIIYPNQYFLVWSDKEHDKYRLFRHNPAENRIFEVKRQKELWSFQGKNPKQQMAIDLLTDDTIQLVCLIGPAGTGKTFLTLLAGLHKVIVEKAYSRLFVARPLVSLGADIGFIPGDLQEKLFHWMHPIYDNLEYIFNEMRAKEEICELFGRGGHGRSQGNRWRSSRGQNGGYNSRSRANFSDEPLYSYSPTIHDSVAMLQQKGLLGLEAITYMRGRSIPRQYIFIDEAQNLTAQEIKTIISRAGAGTKVVLSGDPFQIDSPLLDFYSSGLTITAETLKTEPLVGTVLLEESERSPLAKMAISKL